MQAKSDAELLREYVEHGNESAFAEIVRRHLDLVHSAALRQVESFDLARDVAQGVFTDLARKAPSLVGKADLCQSLLGWLYRSTRFAALTSVRGERRRQARERQAMQEFDPVSEPPPRWEEVRPVLDEAMADLSDADRDALLMRFFKNQDFRSVGAAFGITANAAQQRVIRALEKLRESLAHRGITTSGAALSIALSANAVQAAPAGLAASISTAAVLAGTVSSASTAVVIAKTVAMSTLQKALIAGTVMAVIATGIYGARQSVIRRSQARAAQPEPSLAAQIEALSRKYTEATNELAGLRQDQETLNLNQRELLKLRGEVARLRADSQELAELKRAGSTNAEELAARSLVDRVNRLTARLAERPKVNLPELQFLTAQDWIEVAARHKIDSPNDYFTAYNDLLATGKANFLRTADAALRAFSATNSGQFPSDLSQLRTHFETSRLDELLRRYQIVPPDNAPGPEGTTGPGGWRITLTSKDEGSLGASLQALASDRKEYDISSEMAILEPAMKALAEATPAINGTKRMDIEQLRAYLTTPEQEAAYQRIIQHRGQDEGSK